MKDFETMTVKQLREESKERGLTLESKGKKFTKAQLIERLIKWEKEQEDINRDIQKAIDEAEEEQKETKCEEVKTCADCSMSPCENTPHVTTNKSEDDFIVFAKTLEEIKKKYSSRKKDSVYENELKVGSFIVFVQVVEASSGWIGEKLRTAKVTAINRKKELVKAETFFGANVELTFNELLYIRGVEKNCSYPKDILRYLKRERTEKGKAAINERYAKYKR